jgi:hypothetical protein
LDDYPICHNLSMGRLKKIVYKYYILRSQVWRRQRLLFMSPAEIKFIHIMGGRVVTFDHIKAPRTGFPLAVVITMGRTLRRERIEREVRVGKCFIDFGNDIKRGIEIDGRNFHMDIVKEQERDDYCAGYGWSLLHIQAGDLYRNPNQVQRDVLKYLSH